MTGCSPSPSDPLLISPWEGEGDGSRERGFNCDLKDGSGVLCFSLGSRLRGNDGGWREGRALFTLTLTLSHQGRGDVPGPACAGMTGGQRGQRHGLKKTPPRLHGGVLPCLLLPLGGSQGLRSSLTVRSRRRSRPRCPGRP